MSGARNDWKCLGYQTLTVSTAAVSLTVPTTTGAVMEAQIFVGTSPVRFRDDATVPTATVGTYVAAGSYIYYQEYRSLASLSFIRDTTAGSDATLTIRYIGMPA